LLRPSRDEASTPPADAGYEGEFEEDTDPFDLNGDLNGECGVFIPVLTLVLNVI